MLSFNELNLSSPLKRAIAELGYEKPSPIQAQTLPLLLGERTDFIGQAATGTGKTAAFAIPLLERIDPSRHAVQALVLCPTRELAVQVADQIDKLGRHMKIRTLAVYGGTGYGDQNYGLKRGPCVVVGTPGRLVDHLERGNLKLDHLNIVVLDEADEMISMGFKDDLEKILGHLDRESANTWLFSATMSAEVLKVAGEYLSEPKKVHINKTEVLSNTVEQQYFVTHESNKPEILCKLLDGSDDFYGLVFCQTKSLVIELTNYLKGRDFKVDCLHGDMEQKEREITLRAFRDRRLNLLICTDVASRGLDVKGITHVINYSIPRELDSYVHRIGRTGRVGTSGIAMNLVTPSQRGLVGRIERMTKSKMKEGRIPTRKEIGTRKIAGVLRRFQEQDSFTRAAELMKGEWKTAISGMSREEIAGRFLAMMYPEIFNVRKNS